jgi:hypothetical protein
MPRLRQKVNGGPLMGQRTRRRWSVDRIGGTLHLIDKESRPKCKLCARDTDLAEQLLRRVAEMLSRQCHTHLRHTATDRRAVAAKQAKAKRAVTTAASEAKS